MISCHGVKGIGNFMNELLEYLSLEIAALIAFISYLYAEYVYINAKNKVSKAISKFVYATIKVFGIIYIPYFLIKTIQLLVLLWGWE